MAPSPPRAPVAARAAFSVGVPVALGWLAGDLGAGLLATTGAFTALYAGDLPYRQRAARLAAIALGFCLATTLGVWAQRQPGLPIVLVAAVAVLATWGCQRWRVGAPGAYMFALAVAVGTGIPTNGLALWQVALLVLGGGGVAWLSHLLPALWAAPPPVPAAPAVLSATATALACLRVGIACVLAGGLAAWLELERPYWAMAAAVLVLHKGQAWEATARRGTERMLGTLAGLGLAWALLTLDLQGLALVLAMMALQFMVELLVTRNYALAAVFVTAVALLIASGGRAVADPWPLLLARGEETLLGCLLGLATYAVGRRLAQPHA